MDKKIRPNYMLPTRDTSKLKTHTIESKRMKKHILCKWKEKKLG